MDGQGDGSLVLLVSAPPICTFESVIVRSARPSLSRPQRKMLELTRTSKETFNEAKVWRGIAKEKAVPLYKEFRS